MKKVSRLTNRLSNKKAEKIGRAFFADTCAVLIFLKTDPTQKNRNKT